MIWAWVRWDKSPNSISSKSRGRARQSFCSCWRPRGRVSSGRALIRGLGFTRSEPSTNCYEKSRENAKKEWLWIGPGRKTESLSKNTGKRKDRISNWPFRRENSFAMKKHGFRQKRSHFGFSIKGNLIAMKKAGKTPTFDSQWVL